MKTFEVSPNEPETINDITVSIEQHDLAWDLMLDEPVDVIARDRWGGCRNVHNGGANVPDYETLIRIYDEEWRDIVKSMAYDCEQRSTGIVVWPDDWHDHVVTFKSWYNAARGMFRRNGMDLDDIRIETISPRYHHTSDSFYVVWSQKQMDKHAGRKNAQVSLDYYESILSGDVWFISVMDDKTGDCLDSCGGFVGEYWSDYIQSEAKGMLDYCLRERENERVNRLKTMIRNRVPLHYRSELAQ